MPGRWLVNDVLNTPTIMRQRRLSTQGLSPQLQRRRRLWRQKPEVLLSPLSTAEGGCTPMQDAESQPGGPRTPGPPPTRHRSSQMTSLSAALCQQLPTDASQSQMTSLSAALCQQLPTDASQMTSLSAALSAASDRRVTDDQSVRSSLSAASDRRVTDDRSVRSSLSVASDRRVTVTDDQCHR